VQTQSGQNPHGIRSSSIRGRPTIRPSPTPQPLTTAFRNALAVDGAALVDLDGTFQKNAKGRDVSLLIKAVIAMARDMATAVDSAGLLSQAEEALAQVEE
jgi:hypothetical protein